MVHPSKNRSVVDLPGVRDVDAGASDLSEVAREYEAVTWYLEALKERKEALEGALRAALQDADELSLGGRTVSLETTDDCEYPLPTTLRPLLEAGVTADDLLCGVVLREGQVRTLLALLPEALPLHEVARVMAEIDRCACSSPITRLTVRPARG